MIVIVSQNQYIVASKIFHIVLDEKQEYREIYVNNRSRTIREFSYDIIVLYAPEGVAGQGNGFGQSRNNDETRECCVTIRGRVNAYKVYKSLIQQIREQCPDQLFLDKAIENILNQEDLDKITQEEEHENKVTDGAFNDGSTKKVRRPREEKRRNQKLLRAVKNRNRRGRKRSRR